MFRLLYALELATMTQQIFNSKKLFIMKVTASLFQQRPDVARRPGRLDIPSEPFAATAPRIRAVVRRHRTH